VFEEGDWEKLHAHLFPGDDDEHGAVLLCGTAESDRGRTLLVRDVVLAIDGVDYTPGERSYRKLEPTFIVRQAGRCADEGLSYVAVHNHAGRGSVAFSPTDMRSHAKGYPALLDITAGGPVGALVIAEDAVAGDIWEPHGRAAVGETVVVGSVRRRFYASPPVAAARADLREDRQVRLFGDIGQALLAELRIGLVGLGGAGSLLNQALIHLGIRDLVTVDDDLIDETTLPRVVGTCPTDVGHAKAAAAERLAAFVRPGRVRVTPYRTNVTDPSAARALATCDAIFLAADSMQARHVLNAICMQYLVPGYQVGAKVSITEDGTVTDAFAVARVIGPAGICMWCRELVLRDRLALEALSPEQRRAAQYVPEVPTPSVITMNMFSTALALNDFLFSFTGLHSGDNLEPRRYHFLTRDFAVERSVTRRPSCAECFGRKALGDLKRLPTAMTTSPVGAPLRAAG
jgi:hypothetical protein